MIVTFRPVYVAVLFFFVGRFAYVSHFHGEVQRFTCQWVVTIDSHFIAINGGDGETRSPLRLRLECNALQCLRAFKAVSHL